MIADSVGDPIPVEELFMTDKLDCQAMMLVVGKCMGSNDSLLLIPSKPLGRRDEIRFDMDPFWYMRT